MFIIRFRKIYMIIFNLTVILFLFLFLIYVLNKNDLKTIKMKKITIIMITILTLGFLSCQEEDIEIITPTFKITSFEKESINIECSSIPFNLITEKCG